MKRVAIERVVPGPGQESVWDYPRPPRLERCAKLVQIHFGGVLLAESRSCWRVLETSHPPVYYLPPSDIRMEHLLPSERRSFCEWKGLASYYDVAAGGRRAPDAAWSYPEPTLSYKEIRDHVAFYPQAMERCLVDGEPARAQPGDFYGGWITAEIVGPFKGGAGTAGW
ncbi:MAG TPA: DUF427 domain-containing protein [Thermoanaerobaculia bacterium]|nr:DUF427 domain-containing protein [Thermoanaerobaculia bacterium]